MTPSSFGISLGSVCIAEEEGGEGNAICKRSVSKLNVLGQADPGEFDAYPEGIVSYICG